MILILLFSCQKEEIKPKVTQNHNEKIEIRSTNPDPFFDLMYTYNLLGIEVDRGGSYYFIDESIAYYQNNLTSPSILNTLKAKGEYPCWYCGESENFDYDNFYVPTYDLGSGHLKGLVVLQELEGDKRMFYLSKDVIDYLYNSRENDFSSYWNNIFSYFDNGMIFDNKLDYFLSPIVNCLGSNNFGFCRCSNNYEINCGKWKPGGNGTGGEWDCKDNSACYQGGGVDGGGDGDTSGDGPRPSIAWVWDFTQLKGGKKGGRGTSGGTTTTTTNNNQSWDDLCSSFNGSIPEPPSDPDAGGDFVVDESTGEIAITNPSFLYFIQLEILIDQYELNYTAEQLFDILGEECAVLRVSDVTKCMKCHLISSLGLSESNNWILFNTFSTNTSKLTPDVIDALSWIDRYNISQEQLICLLNNDEAFNAINELDNSDVAFPCEDGKTKEEVVGNIIKSLGSKCNIYALNEAVDVVDKIVPNSTLSSRCPKYDCIFNKMINGSAGTSFICNTIEALENDNSFVLIVGATSFSANNTLNNSGVGLTTVINGLLSIQINSDNCSNHSSLFAFETLQHELVHAKIGHDLISNYGWDGDQSTYAESFRDMVIDIYGTDATADDHKLMLEVYLTEMVNSLIELNNGHGSYSDFEGLVLDGFPADILSLCGISVIDVQNALDRYDTFISDSENDFITDKLDGC